MASKDNIPNGFDDAFKEALSKKRQKDAERKRVQRAAISEEKKEAIRVQNRVHKKQNYDAVKESIWKRESNERKKDSVPQSFCSARKYNIDDAAKMGDKQEPHK